MRVIGAGPVLTRCMLGSLFALWAGSARADKPLTVDIPPQSLAGALAEFAHQTGLQVIYVARLAQSRTSPGTRAGVPPKEALPALLAGTGLGFEFLNERTVRIFDTTNPGAPAVAPVPGARTAKPLGSGRPASLSTPEEEVVVLGSFDRDQLKIDEDIQNTAGSVSMVGGNRLETLQLGQLADYAAYLPSLNLDDGGVPSYYIVQLRGISSNTTDAATVHFYIDGTPAGMTQTLGQGAAPDLIPYDLERIEVRRGPQGTLGGAGSEAGEILYVLNEPNLSGFEARAGADLSTTEYASQPGTSFQGMVNVPIVQGALALRASGYDAYTPGYIENIYTGAKDVNVLRRYGGRVSMLWQPAESLTVKVNALWNRINAQSSDIVLWTGAATAVEGDANIYKVSQSWGTFRMDTPFPSAYQATLDLYSATVRWYPPSVEITSITAWSRNERLHTNDSTGSTGSNFPEISDGTVPAGLSNVEQHTGLDKFSEEFHVSSPHGHRLEWLLGGFYTQERVTDQVAEYAFDVNYQPIAFFAPAIYYVEIPSTFTQKSVFGDLTWHVTDRTDLVGGLRYDHFNQVFTALERGFDTDPAPDAGRYSEGVTTWAATVQHHLTPDAMLYGRIATGFLPGYANCSCAPPTRAGNLTSYESGIKSEFLEHRWIVDLAAFYARWQDIHTGEGARAKSRGVELSGSFSPLRALRLGYNATYIRDQFTERGPDTGAVLTGYQLAQVPKWSAALTADYDWPLKGLWLAHAGGAFRWVGPLWTLRVQSRSEGGAPTYQLPGYSVLDVYASISRAPVVVRVFVHNLAGTRASRHTPYLAIDSSGTVAQTDDVMVRPRTIGVGVDYGF